MFTGDNYQRILFCIPERKQQQNQQLDPKPAKKQDFFCNFSGPVF